MDSQLSREWQVWICTMGSTWTIKLTTAGGNKEDMELDHKSFFARKSFILLLLLVYHIDISY